MINLFYPIKDSTLYEKKSDSNTGMDSILELQHLKEGNKKYNSRIVLKFDQTEINTLISKYNITSASYHLNLYTAKIEESPIEVGLDILPISGAWENGTGNTNDNVAIKNGTSWIWRDFSGSIKWVTSESNSSSYKYNEVTGGGTWYTESQYLVTHSITNLKSDLTVNVSSIFNAYNANTIQNDGILLKYNSASEASNYNIYSYNFFANESNTIYSPKLRVIWDDSSYITGSLSLINSDKEFVVYSRIKEIYNQNEKAKIRIYVRPKFIEKTYATESQYLINYRLPTSSYYEIRDTVTDDIIIPFDETGSKLSCDSSGNYFNLFMDNFQPERFYKILIKVKFGIFDEYILDDNIYFKVVR